MCAAADDKGDRHPPPQTFMPSVHHLGVCLHTHVPAPMRARVHHVAHRSLQPSHETRDALHTVPVMREARFRADTDGHQRRNP
jgi:hypothetical protein